MSVDTGHATVYGPYRIISSQSFLDETIIARWVEDGDVTVSVSPPFEVDGEWYHMLSRRHQDADQADPCAVLDAGGLSQCVAIREERR